jgi:ribulose-phosphate 3-epimerase
MIEHADRWIDAYADAGADMIAVHPETLYHLNRTLHHIHRRDKKAGIAVNPTLPLVYVEEILEDIDYAIVMSVNPGFGGQAFIPGSFERVRRIRAIIDRSRASVLIEADGGIDATNIRDAVDAGVDIVVAGSAIFKANDPAQAARDLIALGRSRTESS